jgi:hypothetical protein
VAVTGTPSRSGLLLRSRFLGCGAHRLGDHPAREGNLLSLADPADGQFVGETDIIGVRISFLPVFNEASGDLNSLSISFFGRRNYFGPVSRYSKPLLLPYSVATNDLPSGHRARSFSYSRSVFNHLNQLAVVFFYQLVEDCLLVLILHTRVSNRERQRRADDNTKNKSEGCIKHNVSSLLIDRNKQTINSDPEQHRSSDGE